MLKTAIFGAGLAASGAVVGWFFGHDKNPGPAGGAAPSVAVVSASTENGKSRDGSSAAAERIVGIGSVDVEGGVTPLTLPLAGAVEKVLASEGQKVSAGESLVTLRASRASAQVAKAEAALVESETRVAKARRAPQLLDLQRRQQDQAIAAAKAQRSVAERQVESLKALAGSQAVSEEKLLAAVDQLDALKAGCEVEQLKLEQLRLEDPKEAATLAQAAFNAAQADLRIARQNLNDHALSAPRDGVVLRVLVSEGQMCGINPLQPAIWFRSNEPLVVRTEVDQAFVGRVRIGMPAELYDDNRQFLLGKGKVVRLAPWIAQRRSLLDEPFQRNDVRTLECIVAIEGDESPYRIGQRLRVVLAASK